MQGHGKLKIMVHTRATMPAKPYVLRPSSVQRFVELSVLDSGPGIAPDIRARLFEPFFTTKRSGAKAGTGLGLSLIYSIAQQESLGLSVESEPGKGACFSLVIPVR
jgi:signal transduction histidine kinase